jgi:SPP1 gp7 family putative phage head morphogenesis protein
VAVNDTVLDFTVARQIDLIRAAAGEADAIQRGVFDPADERLERLLLQAEGGDPSLTVDSIIAAQAALVAARWSAYSAELVQDEVEAQTGLLTRILAPLGVGVATGSVAAALARTRARPADGATPAEWLAQANRGDRERAVRATRAGVAAGDSGRELSRAVVGSASLGRKDGIREVSRRSIQTALQTLTTHAAAQSSAAVWEANATIVKSVRWVSTLDGRTSPICWTLDGTIFPIRQGIRPPAHPHCRSVVMPIIPRLEAIAGAPGRDVLPATVVDRFDGQPPRVLRYEEWLRGRSAKFQREVLGPSRFKLWSEGGISLERFVNDRGQLLTLNQLRTKLPAIFEEVGL